MSDRVDPQDPVFYEALGRAVKVARTERDLDRKDLATMAGISYGHLSDIESGRGRPSSQVLRALAKALGLSVGTLMSIAEARSGPPAEPAAAASPSIPAPSETWTRWERVSATRSEAELSPSSARGELHSLIERLGPDDLAMVLELARRLSRG